jgi:hypothetical protein
VTAHLNRPHVADVPQLGNRKDLGKLGVDSNHGRAGPDRNRDRDDGAAGRRIPGVYVQGVFEVIVMMNGGAMLMIRFLCVV